MVSSEIKLVSFHLSRKWRLWDADVSLLRVVWHQKHPPSVLHNLHRQSTNCQKDLKYYSPCMRDMTGFFVVVNLGTLRNFLSPP